MGSYCIATLGPSWNFSLTDILISLSLQDGLQSQPAFRLPWKEEYFSSHRSGLTQFWNLCFGDRTKFYKWRQPPMGDDLKILKVKYLSNNWWDLIQIWNLRWVTKPNLTLTSNEDNLHNKMTSKYKKENISITAVRSYPNIKCKPRWPNETIQSLKWSRLKMDRNLKLLKIDYLSNHSNLSVKSRPYFAKGKFKAKPRGNLECGSAQPSLFWLLSKLCVSLSKCSIIKAYIQTCKNILVA